MKNILLATLGAIIIVTILVDGVQATVVTLVNDDDPTADQRCTVVESWKKDFFLDMAAKGFAMARFMSDIHSFEDSITFHALSYYEQPNDLRDINKTYDANKAKNIKLLDSPVDFDKIHDELMDPSNHISMEKNGNLVNSQMQQVIDRIGIDHHVRLLLHGWSDSIDSLYKIHDVCK